MIVYPEYWRDIGRPIEIKEIEDAIFQILSEIPCESLSLSGGLDSSLMLYFMTRMWSKVEAFTIGFSEAHPDIKYSRLIAKKFRNVKHEVYIPTTNEIIEEDKIEPREDVPVRLFYKFLTKQNISRIITCDGIDEFMCGYYDHQENPNEETYYKHIKQLQEKHLEPLNRNSDQVKVYLPYLDSKLLVLLSQMPIVEKVTFEQRKTLVVAMAENKIPNEIINRRKYGFCDALQTRD